MPGYGTLVSMYLPTHYKASGQTKGPCCLICQTRTKGATQAVDLGYSEFVYLCEGHASEEFRRQRHGRDFVHSISRACQAAGQMTPRRVRALRRLNRLLGTPTPTPDTGRSRPGSYAHPETRRVVEDACRTGAFSMRALRELVATTMGKIALRKVEPPSPRTLRRWRADRRWAEPGWQPPASARRA